MPCHSSLKFLTVKETYLNHFSSVQSLDKMGCQGKHDRRFSWDSLPMFSVGNHCEQLWHKVVITSRNVHSGNPAACTSLTTNRTDKSCARPAKVSSIRQKRGTCCRTTIHSLMLSILDFLCCPWCHPPSKVPWRMALERLSWRATYTSHASFRLLTVTRRGFCEPTR